MWRQLKNSLTWKQKLSLVRNQDLFLLGVAEYLHITGNAAEDFF